MNDTIAAIATPPGEGGVAIIRISGPKALPIAAQVVQKKEKSLESHRVFYVHVLAEDKRHIDDALLIPMKGPKSYTGEDTVEIQCHGGSVVSRQVLGRVLELGARPAKAGEFSFRAFMNGKLDLAQAEAVQSLIHAKNTYALNYAQNVLQGRLSREIEAFQHRLSDIAAILEAWVDFPEEGLEFASFDEVSEQIASCKHSIEHLAATFDEGRKIFEGIRIALVGRPNVGKSSLMNRLLGCERAIVTDIAGTTRDLVEGELLLRGMHFQIVDTAGIRDEADVIEQEGIRRSLIAASQADIVLYIVDASSGWTKEDEHLWQSIPKDKTLIIWNKSDLKQCTDSLSVSANTGEGMDLLIEAIFQKVFNEGAPATEELHITELRHKKALEEAALYLERVLQGLQSQLSAEFCAFDLRQALDSLGTIIGRDVTEDILSSIFSKFCVGK